jgi:choline kinase
MRAIIIGAGRGQRLMPTTENAPKCFAEIRGKRILDWTVEALTAGGVTDICFIGGYRMESVEREYPQFTFRRNPDWANNNILVSLMCAEDLMDRPFITTYSDILFTHDIVADLVASPADIALGMDTDWREHYRPRSQHPPHDAEKAIARNGKVERVQRNIPYDDATGEFIGVAKFSTRGGELLREHYHRRRLEFWDKPYRESALFQKAYLIHLFQDMIEQGVEFGHADTHGNYREIDTQQDMDLAQTHWTRDGWAA